MDVEVIVLYIEDIEDEKERITKLYVVHRDTIVGRMRRVQR
jgi:hypothetical protein